ncbi:hypothetical protein BD413DRAFT_173339 [Trametes elegans]|nr:hypothetical protein BD413DRAFT_173339 [Trametes elegans]
MDNGPLLPPSFPPIWDHYPPLKIPGMIPVTCNSEPCSTYVTEGYVLPSLQCCTPGAQLEGTVQMGLAIRIRVATGKYDTRKFSMAYPTVRPVVAVGVVRLGGREKRPGPRCRGGKLVTSVARNQGVLGLPEAFPGVASPRAVSFEWSSRLSWASDPEQRDQAPPR